MPTLYVTEQGTTVRLSGGSLHVTRDEDPDHGGSLPPARTVLMDVEPHRLEVIVLVGRVHITRDAVALCLERGIGVAWLAWNGRLLGRLVPEGARSGDLRLAQYRLALDPAASGEWARLCVAAKVANAAAVLRGIRSNQPGLAGYSEALRELAALPERLAACRDGAERLGVEGLASRIYFGVLGAGFRGEIGFSGRQRRPPPDPANALLSFGYVLFGNLIGAAVEARGLDPAVGFLHALRPGRASLALDLLEEFRHPVVDRFVMRTLNLRMLRPEHFEPDPEEHGGVRLTREGLKLFFRSWGEHLDQPLPDAEAGAEGGEFTPVALLRRQVDRVAMALRTGEPYRPFLLRR
ncbi:MAG: CRISPR-associated endonuclease Cas1 [Magnetococcus sp. WYHC-3]